MGSSDIQVTKSDWRLENLYGAWELPSLECISLTARAWLSSVREGKRPQVVDGVILVSKAVADVFTSSVQSQRSF